MKLFFQKSKNQIHVKLSEWPLKASDLRLIPRYAPLPDKAVGAKSPFSIQDSFGSHIIISRYVDT